MSKKRLGRGLDSLLSDKKTADSAATAEPEVSAQADKSAAAQTESTAAKPNKREATSQSGSATLQQAISSTHAEAASGIGVELEVNQIRPSRFQPRRQFDEEAIAELAQSIQTQGLLQPIIVRNRPQGGYELIAGERRWRAAQVAGLRKLPALIKTVSDQQASALALIENIQREDLSALEEAMGLSRLRDEFALTQQQIADAVGKSRVAIANLLRLLNLGVITRSLLEQGAFEMGHARALLGLEGVQQDQAAQRAADQGLSVRQTEALVKSLANPTVKAPRPASLPDADTQRLQQRIMDKIGAPVAIKHTSAGAGELTIKYTSLEVLEGVLHHLGVEAE